MPRQRGGGARLPRSQLMLLALALCSANVLALPSPAVDQKILRPIEPNFDALPLQQQRKLSGRFLHITDFHPDELYRVHSSTEEGIACHRGKGLAGSYGAEKTDCDSPFSLVNATFAWIMENIRDDIDFVIWTGDSARHDSDEEHPRHEPEILRTNRFIADKFVETFSSPGNGLDIPIVPNFGNNDFLPHNIMLPGPNKWFATYSDIWRRFIPEAQRHSFAFGGWFYVEVIPNQLAVFSLNTMYFFDRNAGVDGCAHPSEPGYKHMDWLRVQLQILRERGVKAILMGHVPPARTDSKQLWDETCWQKYTLWLKQYRDVVVGSVFGHMNIDHFLLQDVKELTPELGAGDFIERDSPDETITISSKEDYLQELRDKWSDLPKSVVRDLDDESEEGKKKGNKHKKKKKLGKIGGKYAERYQLSLISPSVVPNFFPTLRIFEYNITGIEDTPVWRDTYDQTNPPAPLSLPEDNRDYEDREAIMAEIKKMKKDKKKGKKGKKDKNKGKPRKPPKDHDLIVPLDPPEDALPGPAYSPQLLTLTGYTQYFANLTHINDDLPGIEADTSKWRKGKHDHKEPKHGEPNPREFRYEVEYSTFDDNIYKLPDLTVKSLLKLAYRMGKKEGSKSKTLEVYDDEEDLDETDEADEYTDNAPASELKKGKGKKSKDKKKSKKEKNKAWLHFLKHAFVSTVPKEELEKM
ncbi:Endopolyphosphatase [Trichoderma citrinoviride]|uniref:Endopolyphosphatase n=1 Tax=Trichoderma citrinoviride TaxID=58853 RepID=A0A2T4BKV9_9HYPO|nr:Endopolyphosphatase [Trichoderma citrinoviride]PTB69948.1 Endopolyphosphatase [Trichoderma citrinoviride]